MTELNNRLSPALQTLDTDSTSSSPPLSTWKLLDLNVGKEQNLTLLEVYLNLIIKFIVLFMTISQVPFFMVSGGCYCSYFANKLLNIRDSKQPSQMPVVLHS